MGSIPHIILTRAGLSDQSPDRHYQHASFSHWAASSIFPRTRGVTLSTCSVTYSALLAIYPETTPASTCCHASKVLRVDEGEGGCVVTVGFNPTVAGEPFLQGLGCFTSSYLTTHLGLVLSSLVVWLVVTRFDSKLAMHYKKEPFRLAAPML